MHPFHHTVRNRFMKRNLFLIRVVLVAFCLQLFASAAAADNVQDRLEKFLRDTSTPGMALSVMHKGDESPRNWYAGFANVELNAPVTPDTTFRIGSITKVFTAVGTMKLVEEGKLNPDTTMDHYFPDLREAGKITVDSLLNHSSGLPDFLFLEPFTSNMARPYTPQEILAMVVRKGTLDFEPGKKSEYSNSGYLVLGLLLEKVSGLTCEDFFQREIIQPLGMHRTAMGSDTTIIKGRAAGYTVEDKAGSDARLQNGSFVSIIPPFASGAIMSRPADFVRLVDLDKVLTPDTVQRMMGQSPPDTPVKLTIGKGDNETLTIRYGLGFELLQFGDSKQTLAAKDGVIPGFASWYVYFPEKKLAVAVSTNNEKAVLPLILLVREIGSSL